MEEIVGPASPPMPLPVHAGVLTITFFILLVVAGSVRDLRTRVLLTAVWLRYAVSSAPSIAIMGVLPGLSVNSIVSLATIGVALLVADIKVMARRELLGIYALCALILVSAAANGALAGGVEAVIKWAYFVVFLALTYSASRVHGVSRLAGLLLTAFSTPILLEISSILLGIPKQSEADGSASYVGGYFHEGGFSVVILTALMLSVVAKARNAWFKIGLVLALFVLLFLVNYRTVVIPGLLLLGAPFLALMLYARRSTLALGVIGLVLPVAALLADGGSSGSLDRFSEASALFSGKMFQPPEYFSEEDQDLLSGRLYIWSSYVYGYLAGGDVQLLFGFGAGEWSDYFGKYAHNTFVSALFEYGPFGPILTLAAILQLTPLSRPFASVRRFYLLLAHVAFFTVHFGTMPFWLVEGLIYYALLCGLTLGEVDDRVSAARRPSVADDLQGRSFGPRPLNVRHG